MKKLYNNKITKTNLNIHSIIIVINNKKKNALANNFVRNIVTYHS